VRYPAYRSHFAIGVLFLICLVCLSRPLSVSSLAQSRDDEAIRKLVGRIFESYQRKALDGMISLWSEKSPFLPENKKVLQKEFVTYEKIVVKEIEIRQIKIDGGRASIRVSAEMMLTRAHLVNVTEKLERKNRTMDLVDEGGVWKVSNFAASEEELAAAIIAAKTEAERKALMEKEPELITSDLAAALSRQIFLPSSGQVNYQRALAINQLAFELAEKTGDQPVLATIMVNLGKIHRRLGTSEQSTELALDYFRKSLSICEKIGFKECISASLLNSALVYHNFGELSPTEEYYQKALSLDEELGNYDAISTTLNNLGVLYRAKGNYAKALEMLLKCLKLSERRLESGKDWSFLATVLINIGGVFTFQGNFEQGLAYCRRAIDVTDKAIMMGDTNGKLLKANALQIIGSTYRQHDENILAMEYFQKSLKLTEEFGETLVIPKDRLISSIKVEIGNIFAAKNNAIQAIENYREALQFAENSKDKTKVPYPLWSLAKIYLSQGNYQEALAFATRAVNAAEAIGQFQYQCDALVTVGEAYRHLGQSEDALVSLAKAIEITEELRGQSVGSELDRQRAFESAVTPYQAMIDLQVDQKRFREAFTYAQRAKGRTLLELLHNGRVKIDKSESIAEQEQEQQLSRKIISLNRQITGEKLKPKLEGNRLHEFEEQLKKTRLEFEAFQIALYTAHPELKVKRGEIRQVSFNDVGSLIPDSKTAILDFIVTGENVHLFVLTKDQSSKLRFSTQSLKIKSKALAEMVERFRRRMENRDYDFQSLSHELYDLLIRPVRKQLENKSSLIISPDHLLWDLPFQVLLSPENRYLIEDAAISYAPSLSVLREMQLARKKKSSSTKPSILALGDPALGTQSREMAKLVKMDAELQPLPEAADQVRALGRLYGPKLSRIYTGPSAREELVKEQSADYRILHLATHGILNDVSPMYSNVMLSQTPGKGDEDGLLEAWEMMNLDLNADLVVLSACETARGRVGAGEGVIGMTWALFVAGCPRTLVSQWKVEASSTTALMVEFHKGFKTRYGGPGPVVSTAGAMRQAALKVMRNPEYAHPFYWGGFVVIGDGN
jgi:CHAT domain-containing protein